MENTLPEIQAIRTDYAKSKLDELTVNKNPILQFKEWLSAALRSQLIEPTAMCISTLDSAGFPSGRIVLLRAVNETGFTFFTNYTSQKGKDIERYPKVSLNFFWPDLERQVRVVGTIAKISPKDSDEYFNSRPRQSQIGAWASDQSEVLSHRSALEEKEKEFEKIFENKPVPRPEFWGGYNVSPLVIEFWQGRPSRLHDRIRYSLLHGEWEIERLNP